MIAAYFKYLFRAGNAHAIHSPFVFDLYNRLINVKDSNEDYTQIQKLRKELLSSTEIIEILDLGAGSRVNKSNKRKVKTIARNAEKPEKFGRLFYRLIKNFQPQSILELGTSLGLTTLYLSKANPDAAITSFEGCPQTAAKARSNFERMGVRNVEVVLGNIDQTLPEKLRQLNQKIDFVHVDANHRYEPTVRYFEDCLSYVHENSLFIFDDIYWSAEMTAAWKYIKAHPDVTVTIDLFWIGLVFFRKGQAKEDFVLRF
ncbi:O-methyltransferase [Dyadobacter crusticola]|uniref:O-methyltransferase n=1 Tax=Dyadobacter crusticola TaxID=292407 RepID=UPI0004E1EFC8|nr:class I SAM-dependent methyltransferase [Dyadobacter crusticola]